MTHQNYNSSKVQLFFFLIVPNVLVYCAVAFLFLPFDWTKDALIPIAAIGVLWSLLGGFICAANMSLISAIGEPSKPVISISIGADEIKATSGMEYSSSQKAQASANLFFSVILAIPVAIIGWVLFLLYCNGKFLGKLKTMQDDLDKVCDILTTPTNIDEVAYYFYRMLDYAQVYKNLNERKGAEKMLNYARDLLEVWKKLL